MGNEVGEDLAMALEPIEIDPGTFLSSHCSLPSLPAYAHRIQEMIHGDDVDIKSITDVISGEPALVAGILKVVNSSYYSLPREISDLRFAIAFLGLNEVYRMVLSLIVIQSLDVGKHEEVRRYWFHSFYTALCTKKLAAKYERHLAFDELWSPAILHDIGKLVYLKFFPDHYSAMAEYCRENGCLFADAEAHFSVPTTSLLGTLLCDHWQLPERVKTACAWHRLPDLRNSDADSPGDMFKRMICLGNLTAILSAESLNETVRQEVADTIMAAMSWTEAEFLDSMGAVFELKNDAETFVGQFA
jgi:HD-like signal output (HDOD) protein